jgi:hypothetical protein
MTDIPDITMPVTHAVMPSDMSKARSEDLPWIFVKLTHRNHHDRIVFRSLSETRARGFVERRYPRGSEAYLLLPDGSIESYEAERQGEFGTDIPQWMKFDPASWNPPDQQAPPGETMWSDKEG